MFGASGLARLLVSDRAGALLMPHWLIEPGELRLRGQDNPLAGVPPEVGRDRYACIMLPEPIVDLILRQSWSNLLCFGRWLQMLMLHTNANPFGAWPPHLWLSNVPAQDNPPHQEEPSADRCVQVVLEVQTLSRGLLQALSLIHI